MKVLRREEGRGREVYRIGWGNLGQSKSFREVADVDVEEGGRYTRKKKAGKGSNFPGNERRSWGPSGRRSDLPGYLSPHPYLDAMKVKKRVVKPSEKFGFSFDRETTEYTAQDMILIYQNPHEAQLLFGCGFRGGMDCREQKKLAAKNEKGLRAEIRLKDGVEERPEAEAQKQKEEAANVYDTFDMRVDHHWSNKELEEMTERDWRIFREDFNVSYKVSFCPP